MVTVNEPLELAKVGAGIGIFLSLVFRRWEPPAHIIVVNFPVFFCVLCSAVLPTKSLFAFVSLRAAVLLASILGSLFVSILGYRLGPWHPLAAFPGPKLAKCSKVWSIRVGLTGKKHLVIEELHNRYGDIVRIGPNELSIRSVEAHGLIYSSTNKLWRGPLYRSLSPKGTSILGQRNPVEHKKRRVLWDRAFSTTSVSEYEPALYDHTSNLTKVITKFAESREGFDLHAILSYYALDFAGYLAFSSASSFHLLRDLDDVEGHTRFLRQGARYVQAMNQISWVYDILHNFLPQSRGVQQFRAWARERVQKRLEAPSQTKDVFTYLSDASEEHGTQLSHANLAAEALILITAGSDTTLWTLTLLFYQLLSHPEYLCRAQAEVDTVLGPRGGTEPTSLVPANLLDSKQFPFLQACIEETLRLHPATPVGLQRIAPSTGITLSSGAFIPGGSFVGVPGIVLHHSSNNFSDPLLFRPDRFLRPESEKVFNRAAFVPFSTGYTACPGKSLAYKQVLLSSASLLWRFEFSFAKGLM